MFTWEHFVVMKTWMDQPTVSLCHQDHPLERKWSVSYQFKIDRILRIVNFVDEIGMWFINHGNTLQSFHQNGCNWCQKHCWGYSGWLTKYSLFFYSHSILWKILSISQGQTVWKINLPTCTNCTRFQTFCLDQFAFELFGLIRHLKAAYTNISVGTALGRGLFAIESCVEYK